MRYQFYREHKYVCAAVNDVERLIARTDFRDLKEISKVAEAFEDLKQMLQAHAHYENEKLHTLLSHKHSKVYEHAEKDHIIQDEQLKDIQQSIEHIQKIQMNADRIEQGYQLYLKYRKFAADNLLHLHEEETLILPELQRLYTDAELKKVEAKTYHEMTPDQLVDMMEVLFPHMNPIDREAFLSDIYEAEPDKFMMAWKQIGPTLPEKEQVQLTNLSFGFFRHLG